MKNIVIYLIIMLLLFSCGLNQKRNYVYKVDFKVYDKDFSLTEKDYKVVSPIKLQKISNPNFIDDVVIHKDVKEVRFYNLQNVFYIRNDVYFSSGLNQGNYQLSTYFDAKKPNLKVINQGKNYHGDYWKEVITREVIYGYLVKDSTMKRIFENILDNFEINNQIKKDSTTIKIWETPQ